MLALKRFGASLTEFPNLAKYAANLEVYIPSSMHNLPRILQPHSCRRHHVALWTALWGLPSTIRALYNLSGRASAQHDRTSPQYRDAEASLKRKSDSMLHLASSMCFVAGPPLIPEDNASSLEDLPRPGLAE